MLAASDEMEIDARADVLSGTADPRSGDPGGRFSIVGGETGAPVSDTEALPTLSGKADFVSSANKAAPRGPAIKSSSEVGRR